jgi:hypothetical protein
MPAETELADLGKPLISNDYCQADPTEDIPRYGSTTIEPKATPFLESWSPNSKAQVLMALSSLLASLVRAVVIVDQGGL